MKFSTIRNRRDYTYQYETPVRRLGFDKVLKHDEQISENQMKEMNEIKEIDFYSENDETDLLEGKIYE